MIKLIVHFVQFSSDDILGKILLPRWNQLIKYGVELVKIQKYFFGVGEEFFKGSPNESRSWRGGGKVLNNQEGCCFESG
jgi:hypothetical protein